MLGKAKDYAGNIGGYAKDAGKYAYDLGEKVVDIGTIVGAKKSKTVLKEMKKVQEKCPTITSKKTIFVVAMMALGWWALIPPNYITECKAEAEACLEEYLKK